MSEDLHPIDDLFRSGLQGKEDVPAPKVWDAIKQELDKKDRKPIGGFFHMSGRAAAIALIILGSAALFAGGYYLRGVQLSNEQKKASGSKESPEGKGQSMKSGVSSATPGSLGQQGEQAGSASAQPGSTAPVSVIPDQGPASVDRGLTATAGGAAKEDGEGKQEAGQNKAIHDPSIKGSAAGKTDRHWRNQEPVRENKSTGKGDQKAPAKPTIDAQHTEGSLDKDPAGLSAPATTAPKHSDEHRLSESEVTEPHHDPALVEVPEHEHTLPAAARYIPAGSGAMVLSSGRAEPTAAPVNPTQIPVANKRATGLQLPRISITPMVAYQHHSMKLVDDGSWRGKEMHEDMARTEHMPSKISGGILADLRIGKRMTLQSGLSLMQMEVYIEPKKIKAEKDIDGKVKYRLDCSAGTYFINPKQGNYLRPGDTISTKEATNSLRYLTIPLALKYYFGNNKFQVFTTAGAGLNILTNQQLNAMVNHQYQYYGGRTTNLKNSFFSGMVGAGINYYVGKRIGIYMSPQYNFALGSLNEGLPVKAMPRTFSVQTGVVIKL